MVAAVDHTQVGERSSARSPRLDRGRSVPWPAAAGRGDPAVYDVQVRRAVVIRAEGRRFCSWSAPTRTGRDAVVKAWQEGRTSALPGPATGVVSTWHRPAIIVGAIAGLWAVGTILV